MRCSTRSRRSPTPTACAPPRLPIRWRGSVAVPVAGVARHPYAALSRSRWRRSFTDPLGEIWTPFAIMRADAINADISNQPGVSNFLPGRHPGTAPDADRRPRISLSLHQRAAVGLDRRSRRSRRSSSVRTKPMPASCRTRTRRAWSSTPRTCSASTSSPAMTASKAAAGPMSASNPSRNSTAAAPSTCCSANPTSCSGSIPSRCRTSPTPASIPAWRRRDPTMSPASPTRRTRPIPSASARASTSRPGT